MKIIPYLVFNGECKDALNYYKRIFDGEISYLQTYGEMPPQDDMQVPEDYKDKILHGEIKFGDNSLYFSDAIPIMKVKSGSNLSLTVSCESENEIITIYDKFYDTSKVEMPLQDTFWNAKFATLVDKYGYKWSLNYAK